MKTKAQLRQSQQSKIAQWLPANLSAVDRLYQQLFASEMFIQAKTIAVTISMDQELDTAPIIQRAQQLNKQIFVPETLAAAKKLNFRQLTSQTQFKKTKFGVIEPINGKILYGGADLTIVPALAISLDKHQRIGFGAGYYDRYLQNTQTKSVTLAIDPVVFEKTVWDYGDLDQTISQIIY